jgi:beta-glucosidase
MVTRLMAPYYLHEQDSPSYPKIGVGMAPNLLLPHTLVDARVKEARPVLMQSAIEGHVLVKNTNNALPLKEPRILSLFGYDAVAPDTNTPGVPEVSYMRLRRTCNANMCNSMV